MQYSCAEQCQWESGDSLARMAELWGHKVSVVQRLVWNDCSSPCAPLFG